MRVQRPAESAFARASTSAVLIVTEPPGMVVPSSRYDVASSSTSRTATAGSLTAIVGGFEKRRSCMPSQTMKTTTNATSNAKTIRLGENVSPRRGAAIGRGTEMTG